MCRLMINTLNRRKYFAIQNVVLFGVTGKNSAKKHTNKTITIIFEKKNE